MSARAPLFPATVTLFTLLLFSTCFAPGLSHAIELRGVTVDGAAVDPEQIPQLSHHVEVAIHDEVAATRRLVQLRNDHDAEIEVTCSLQLTSNEVIDGFSYWNGEERVVGEVLEKAAAQKVYEELTGVQRDPGLGEQVGSSFRFRVYPVKPGETKPIEVDSVTTLELRAGVVEYVVPAANLPRAGSFTFRADVTDDLPIEDLEVPGTQAVVTRLGARHVRVSFERSVTADTPPEPVLLRYRLRSQEHSMRMVTYRDEGTDGSFMLRIAPKEIVDDSEVVGRDVVLLVDISGSMGGLPLAQTRAGVEHILRRLGPTDRFEVVPFDDEAVPFYGGLQHATAETVADAVTRVQALRSRGGTNILGGLQVSLSLLSEADKSRPRAIVFLTDGQGNNPAEVVLAHVRRHSWGVRVYTFGAGGGVNRPFLTRLASDNRGIATMISNEREIEGAMKAVYERIAMPLMVDLELDFGDARVHSVYPKQLPDLYRDSEVVVFGRFRGEGPATIRLAGQLADETSELELEAELPKLAPRHAWIEKLWAKRRVDHLLDTIALRGGDELVSEVTRLGIVYDLVTPYTAFLAVPESLKTDEVKAAIRRGTRGYDRRLVDSMKGIRLSQSHIPPGDPVLTVAAPADAQKVVAYFPFGLTLPMRYDPIRDRWAVRFLVPRDVTDGTYTIRVLIVEASGRSRFKSIDYVIDGTAPEFDASVPSSAAPGEEVDIEVDPFEQVASVFAYILGDPAARVELELDPDLGTYVGTMAMPAVMPDEGLTVRVVVRDLARNRFEQDFEVFPVPEEEHGEGEITGCASPAAPPTPAR